MKLRLFCSVAVLCLCAATDGRGQELPVGPVRPKPSDTPHTVSSYEKAFEALLKGGAPDKLWGTLNVVRQRELLKEIEDAQMGIMKLPVGPVPPRPTVPGPNPKNPKPRPVNPNPKPTQEAFDDALRNLHEALERTSKSNPQMSLPPQGNEELQLLIQKLTKGAPQ